MFHTILGYVWATAGTMFLGISLAANLFGLHAEHVGERWATVVLTVLIVCGAITGAGFVYLMFR